MVVRDGLWCWLKDGRTVFNMFPGRIRNSDFEYDKIPFFCEDSVWWQRIFRKKYGGGVWKLNYGNLHHRLTFFAIPFS